VLQIITDVLDDRAINPSSFKRFRDFEWKVGLIHNGKSKNLTA
jgi:hypothetical protein